MRQIKYLNNLIEQDHRFIKRLTRARDGLFLLRDRVANPCRGFEIMNMIRKGQVQGVAKGDVKRQVAFVAQLFGIAV